MTQRKKYSDLDSYPNTKSVMKDKLGITNLEENQYSGVVVYSTYTELPTTGTLLVSYKVSNDPDPELNGFYHWSGSAYIKDEELSPDVNALIELNAGKIFATLSKYYTFGGYATTSMSTPTSVYKEIWIPEENGTIFGYTIDNYENQYLLGTGTTGVFLVKTIEGLSEERVVNSENLFDKSDRVNEYWYHNLTTGYSVNLKSSNFIKVNPNRSYRFIQASGYRHGIYGFAKPDNSELIGRLDESASKYGNYSFDMPSDFEYVKIGWVGTGEAYDELKLDDFALYETPIPRNDVSDYDGEKATDEIDGRIIKLKENSIKEHIKEVSGSINLLNYSKITQGYKINDASDGLKTDDQASVSSYLPCKQDTDYVIKGFSDWYERKVLYLDEDFQVLSGAVIASGSEYFKFVGDELNDNSKAATFTSPSTSTIKWMIVSVHKSQPTFPDFSESFMVYEGTEYKPFVNYVTKNYISDKDLAQSQEDIDEYIENKTVGKRFDLFQDKTVLLIGDSITSNNRWVYRFMSLLRPKQYYNRSDGGKRLVQPSGTVDLGNLENTGCESALQFVQDYGSALVDAPDIILLCLGTNEFGKTPNTDVAEEDIDNAFTNDGNTLIDLSTVDITKINGALRYMVETLFEAFEDATFFVWTPLPNVSSTWATQKACVNTIRWTCQRMAVPFIDLHADSNIITLFDYPASVATARNIIDGTHPFSTSVTESKAVGKTAEFVASKIVDYMMNNVRFRIDV